MAEEKWSPPDDPVFQLVPPDFESHVTRCFEDLGKPDVTFDTFWDVYRLLRDLVETAVPDGVALALGESIRDDTDGVPESFELAHLDEPDIRGIAVGVDESGGGDEGGALYVEFTNEEGGDQLF